LGACIYNVWPHLTRGRTTAKTTAAPARPVDAALAAATAASDKKPAPSAEVAAGSEHQSGAASIELSTVLTGFRRWVESPRRDPFQFLSLRLTEAPKGPPASERLSIKALWHQTGGRLAVVNGIVAGEGDKVLDYRIQQIHDDYLVVKGSNGLERVEFRLFGHVSRSVEAAKKTTP
jgi:hypothetical protein